MSTNGPVRACSKCKREISALVAACPFCGDSQQQNQLAKKSDVGASGVIMAIVVVGIAIWFLWPSSTPNPLATAPTAVSIPSAPAVQQQLLTLDDGWTVDSDESLIYIKGTVHNPSTRTFSLATISFDLFDKSGARVGTALDNINNLAPGQAWKFKAYILDKGAQNAKLAKLEGF
jgi:hypothetical protein